MQKTQYYNMNLPEGADYYNIDQFNENATITDTTMHNLQATLSATASEIQEMKQTFQAGVDACYNACVTKGSTPASYALSDVVQGILDIETGGECYSMFPQETLGVSDEYACEYDFGVLKNNSDVVIAYIVPTSSASINMNFTTYISADEVGTIAFSLVIDNEIVIPNISTITFTSTSTKITHSFSYTLTTPLTTDYHIIKLRTVHNPSSLYGYVDILMCNFYGSGFVGNKPPKTYLENGSFVNYIPSNFINPVNSIEYQLQNIDESYLWEVEAVDDAMNNYYSDTFDSGSCYNFEGVTGYYDYNESQIVYPSLEDTFVFNNTIGKFVYHHPRSRTFDTSDTMMEYHSFILPVISNFYKYFDYINIRIHLSSGSPQDGNMYIYAIERESQNSVLKINDGSPDYIYLSELSEGDQMLTLDVTNINNSMINFFQIYVEGVMSEDEYTFEIDYIWGSNVPEHHHC